MDEDAHLSLQVLRSGAPGCVVREDIMNKLLRVTQLLRLTRENPSG
jgi:hypothetical protein